MRNCFENLQGVGGSIRGTLFKILFYLSHDICHMRETENLCTCAASEGIEGGRFHFHRKHAS